MVDEAKLRALREKLIDAKKGIATCNKLIDNVAKAIDEALQLHKAADVATPAPEFEKPEEPADYLTRLQREMDDDDREVTKR